MDRKFKVGIIGTGGIAHAHARASQTIDQIELAAVCDINIDSASEFQEAYGAGGSYGTVEEMLKRIELDIAIICTWGHTHAEIARELSGSGRVRAILCEKPFCKDAPEAADMVSSAMEHGVLLAEAFKFRHHPQHLKIKELVDSGTIGRVHTIRSTFLAGPVPIENLHPDTNWRFNKSKGGGAIYDLGCYCIHHARFISDSEPDSVFAVGYRGPVTKVDEAVTAILEFPGETTASISIGFRTHGEQTAAIYGDKGAIRCGQAWNNENQPVSVKVDLAGGNSETFDFAPTDQFALQQRHMCECLDSGTPHRISTENSVAQMRVIDALFRSMETGEVETP